MSLNILFLSTENPYPADHGHHIRTFNVLKHLAGRNRVFFLAFAKSERELAHRKELEKICVSVDVIPLPELKQPWRLYLGTICNLVQRDPFIVTRYRSEAARARIRRLIEDVRIDVVHFDLPHLASYVQEVRGIPKLLVHHNVESLRVMRRAQLESNYFKRMYLHYQASKLAVFESGICDEFDRCVAVSDFDKDQLEKLSGTRKFAVVPNGVDTEYFRSQRRETKPEGLVWTGGMGGAYNADAVDYFLTSVAPLILSEQPQLPMVFVGDEPTKLLEKKAAEHTNIVATGYVDDVRPYVDRAAVFIAPLRSGSGTKLKILNAMAQQKAVVTTPIGAEGIDAAPDQEIVIANDPGEFARRVLWLVHNPAAAAAIGKRARRLVERQYDWRVISDQMSEIYENISSVNTLRKSVFAVSN